MGCCQSGQREGVIQVESSSVFGRPEDASPDQIAITSDFMTPLCKAFLEGTE